MKTSKYIILLIIVIILSMNSIVNANTNDSYKINITSSNTSLKPGEIVTISLKVTDINIQSGEKGIGAYEGIIVYDTNIFEGLKMTGNDSWDTPSENEGQFTSVKSDGICTSEAQEIAQIKLKVKENATKGETKIEIKNFEASNGLGNIKTEDAELKINIIEEVQDNNNIVEDNTTDENTTKEDNSVTKGNNIVNSNVNKNNIQVSNKLPHAGLSQTLGTVIIITIIAGIYSYTRYNRTY